MNIVQRAAASALIALAAAGAAGAAETQSALTMAEVVAALTDAGMTAKLSKESSGQAPFVEGRVKTGSDEIVFWIRGRECGGEPAACGTLILFANFDLGRDMARADLDVTNGYNDTQEYGRAYALSEKKQVGVDYVIEVKGGVTRDHLLNRLRRWPGVVETFVKKFREAQPTK